MERQSPMPPRIYDRSQRQMPMQRPVVPIRIRSDLLFHLPCRSAYVEVAADLRCQLREQVFAMRLQLGERATVVQTDIAVNNLRKGQ